MKPTVSVICPKVRIPERVWKRLLAYIDACPMEVGGMGTVEARGGELLVTEVFLIEQEVSPASMEFDPGGFARFVGDWARQGRDLSLLRFWWHSHADFDCQWSDIDLRSMARLSRLDYLVSFVGNHRHESRTRLTLAKPFAVAVDDIPLEVVPEIDVVLAEEARAEVRQKVRKRRFRRSFFDAKSALEPERPVEASLSCPDADPFGLTVKP